MAGYSETPLAKKLGIDASTGLFLINAPAKLAVELNAAASSGRQATPNVIVIFATEGADLDRRFLSAMRKLPPDGAIWCAWPKKVAKVPTDITEDLLRELFLPTGMVDNKVCAIDDIWSGLRFVVRKELRNTWNRG
jgi:hypothetical protein